MLKEEETDMLEPEQHYIFAFKGYIAAKVSSYIKLTVSVKFE